MDGKHARNTRNSSPLGQLFDHGCDAILSTISMAINCSLLGVTASWIMLYCFCFLQCNVYAKNWKARHTGTFDYAPFDVDELMMIGQGILLLTAIKGPDLWKTVDAFGYTFDLWMIIVSVLSISGCLEVAKVLRNVSRYYCELPETSKLRQFYAERYFELGNLILFHISLFAWNTVGIISTNPTLFIVTIAMTFGHLTHRLIICDVTQQKSRRVQYIIIPFVVIGILAVMEKILGAPVMGDLSMRDERVLVGVALYSGYFMWTYAIRCMLDISNLLDIYIFRYNVPEEEKKEK